jgi:hypothetical protein
MKQMATLTVAYMLFGLIGCGPAASSDAMKDLQARIDVVLQLRAIHNEREFTLTKPCVTELESYADQLFPEEDTRKKFSELTNELWLKRSNEKERQRLTRELASFIELPEKYAEAYAF